MRKKYTVLSVQNESSEKREHRETMKEFIIKLSLLIADEERKNRPNQELIDFIKKMRGKFANQYNIEISEIPRKGEKRGTQNEPQKENPKLRELHEEKRLIRDEVKNDFERFKMEGEEFYKIGRK